MPLDNISPDEARRLVQTGGTLLCLDVPEGTELGIDYRAYSTGPRFKGVKMIPQGLHLVYYSSRSEHGADSGSGMRVAFFVMMHPGSVSVRRWDASTEQFSNPATMAETELNAFVAGVRTFDFDRELAPYALDDVPLWSSLSHYLSTEVLERCGVAPGTAIVPGDAEEFDANRKENRGQAHVVPFFDGVARVAKFTPVPDRRRKAGMSPAEITKYNTDHSVRLLEYLREGFGDSSTALATLFGELQLSFILFLFLSSLSALEQWKEVVHIFCACEDAMFSHAGMMIEFLKVLKAQLQQVPTDFFIDELSKENFLVQDLQNMYEVLVDADIDPALAKAGRKMKRFLKQRFGWEITEIPDGAEVVDESELPAGYLTAHMDEDDDAGAFDGLAPQPPPAEDGVVTPSAASFTDAFRSRRDVLDSAFASVCH